MAWAGSAAIACSNARVDRLRQPPDPLVAPPPAPSQASRHSASASAAYATRLHGVAVVPVRRPQCQPAKQLGLGTGRISLAEAVQCRRGLMSQTRAGGQAARPTTGRTAPAIRDSPRLPAESADGELDRKWPRKARSRGPENHLLNFTLDLIPANRNWTKFRAGRSDFRPAARVGQGKAVRAQQRETFGQAWWHGRRPATAAR